MGKELTELTKVNWHAMSVDQVIQYLQTRFDGLTYREANERLGVYGFNKIKAEKRTSKAAILTKQLKEPLIIILLVAITISTFVGDLADAIIIVAIVTLSILVGFIQEFKSEKAIEALKKMTAATCRVIRNNEESIIDVAELVPGDVILISAGDKVPADAYLIEAHNLKVYEAPLTGESAAVDKTIAVLSKDTPIADRKNILYTITTVTHGRGKALVFSTAMDTQLGKVAAAVQAIDVQKTPFEIKIRYVAKTLSKIMLAVVGIVSIVAFIRGLQLLEILVLGISLAVAAVPEALPAVITASLSLGTHRMAKQNAIVRRLPAVETLGSANVICSDKTGTLTKGEMTVTSVYVYDKFAHVSGLGYSLKGDLSNSIIHKKNLMLLAKTMVLCNDAKIEIRQDKTDLIGDPTEIALLVCAHKIGITKDRLSAELPRVQEVPFTPERKIMTTIHMNLNHNNKLESYVKGACEVIMDRCINVLLDGKSLPLSDEVKARIMTANDQMAKKGLRVLALAYKELREGGYPQESIENDLMFLGLVGMMDPPRTEAIDSIAQCKSSGIKVIMITGDHELTAEAVAREIGIIDDTTSRDRVMISGKDLETIDVKTLSEKVDYLKVYSRVSPEHKLKIVQALQSKGHIVAMTGDGINDAPALKAADIGIAMGVTGSQVTKESASMILADDNFATIVSAVKEGRRIFDNVKKYLVYLLSVNLSEIIILAFSIMLGWPLPLLPKHILYINLATDGSPAIALGLEPHEPGIMKRKPRNPNESIFFGIKKWLIPIPIILASISLLLFAHVLQDNGWNSTYAIQKARTMVFGVIVFFELFFALSSRSFTHTINKLGFFSNKILLYSLLGESSAIVFIMNYPLMQTLFDFVSLQAADWILLLLLATTGFVYSEIIKFIASKKRATPLLK
ncbi:MAG TPA: cation-translocating P-type ATPase [Nitrososphaeraceae archaeon]|nr:cation-translocating P-type ATPase [Nitrososphaeraceae archaeon]